MLLSRLAALTANTAKPDQKRSRPSWDNLAAGRAQTRIIVTPNEATPHDCPARARVQRETTGLSRGFPARGPSPEELPLTSGNYQNLSNPTGDGLVFADAPDPLVPYIERGRL